MYLVISTIFFFPNKIDSLIRSRSSRIETFFPLHCFFFYYFKAKPFRPRSPQKKELVPGIRPQLPRPTATRRIVASRSNANPDEKRVELKVIIFKMPTRLYGSVFSFLFCIPHDGPRSICFCLPTYVYAVGTMRNSP